jgi:crotonobetainyl-CoA hydratase
MMNDAPAATLERTGRVGVVTLNRPAALNAVNADLSTAVGEALQEVDDDDALGVAVVTGAGRAFCAGADLKEIAAGRPITAPAHPEWGYAGLVEHPIGKPIIAAVNGFALGLGTEIVLACDLAVLSAEAALGLPEVKRGLFAGADGLVNLARQVPMKVAMQVALCGEPVPAQEALRLGLVNRVAPAGEVLAAAVGMAEVIAAHAPLSVRTSKAMVRAAIGQGSAWDHDVRTRQAGEMQTILASRDAVEGATAFAEKRPPVWTGH